MRKVKIIEDFPEFRQTSNYDCGAAAMEAVLMYYGYDVPEKKIMKIAETNRHGTRVNGLLKVAKKFGLKYTVGTLDIEDLKKNIDNGKPTILALQAWLKKDVNDWSKHWADGHYVVAIGYDTNKIYFEDPSATIRTYLTFRELEERWHDLDAKTNKKFYHMGITFYGKKPKFKLNEAIHMDYKNINVKKMRHVFTYRGVKVIK
ncbi:MAG: cysteine peptidase family C39 domain-containing protein [Nanoarchaeota archaeon]